MCLSRFACIHLRCRFCVPPIYIWFLHCWCGAPVILLYMYSGNKGLLYSILLSSLSISLCATTAGLKVHCWIPLLMWNYLPSNWICADFPAVGNNRVHSFARRPRTLSASLNLRPVSTRRGWKTGLVHPNTRSLYQTMCRFEMGIQLIDGVSKKCCCYSQRS